MDKSVPCKLSRARAVCLSLSAVPFSIGQAQSSVRLIRSVDPTDYTADFDHFAVDDDRTVSACCGRLRHD
jgi:hypothetical protein